MWSRNIRSGTEKYSAPRDVLVALLDRLIKENSNSAWAHFELVNKGGWFWNFFSGSEPWIEVANRADGFLELNSGFSKSNRASMPPIPDQWAQKTKNLRIVPVSARDELITWIDSCFAMVAGDAGYRVMGWLDGL
jgi:hypothetical protein